MLKDRTTNKTYSGRTDALRELGKNEFNRRIKNNTLEYVKTVYVG